MALAIDPLYTFIEKHGSAIDRARLAALRSKRAIDQVPKELHALQNADGGFKLFLQPGDYPSTLSPTCYALTWLRDLGKSGSDEAQRALKFIAGRQTRRGIWRESADIQRYDVPPWMDPESPAADVYTTALCASTLAIFDSHEWQIDQAVTWLQSQQRRDGLLSGFKAHSSWIAIPAFVQIFGDETRATRRLIGGLGELLSDDWTPSMLAWMLQSLLDAGYTERTELVDRAWARLATMQQPDGSLGSEEGEHPVHTALQTIDVAQRLGKIGGQHG